MSWRLVTDAIIDISEGGARLRVDLGRLVVERAEAPPFTLPLDEIAAILVSHPAVTMSQGVLSGLAASGAILVCCDARRMPAAMLMPIEGHFVQAERMVRQAAAPLPLRKRLWQEIVREKLRAQARLLCALTSSDAGLKAMAARVRSGDPENLEAQAAVRYWPRVFGDSNFRRSRAASDQNRFLNYGYAVLRAAVARAISGVGLHPSIGLHHHNRYDAFCLADDLMEPFRPVVDRVTASLVNERGGDAPMDRDVRSALIGAVTARYELDGEDRTLSDWIHRAAQKLADAYLGREKRLDIAVP